MNDVTSVNGKFRFRTISTKAKNELIKLKLFDSKGQITELGKQVNLLFKINTSISKKQ
ncbi:MAG: hypothetical protein IPG89_08295 [Bacteroidetes bacterium]|nr:hypothetical protein [Bacteroidota bacterium]